MEGNLIEQFVEKKALDAMNTLVSTQSDDEAVRAAVTVSEAFGEAEPFKSIADMSTGLGKKLTLSFERNLELLIQKTWVEKSDEDLKAQVQFQLEEFCKNLETHSYQKAYTPFFSIVDNVVYLMFGSQTKSKEFAEYALRIDPEFGIFWWYMQNLPRNAAWSEPKGRIAIMLGMYFLANY